tara:strand:- start:588 stop:722 length:135 start_codon:yes stop_codon:yes gene_type:complete
MPRKLLLQRLRGKELHKKKQKTRKKNVKDMLKLKKKKDNVFMRK